MAQKNAISNFAENLELAIKQMKDEDTERATKKGDEFSPQEYWDKMGKLFKAMSHEATKLSIAFTSEPVPTGEVLESLFTSVEKNTLAFMSVYYGLPKSQGLYLWKSTQRAVTAILEDLKSLVDTISHCQAGSLDQFQSTGTVWQDADRFPSIPKNNKEAVLAETSNCLGLVTDGLTEIQEAAENDSPIDGLVDMMALGEDAEEEDENKWTESDKKLLMSCLGMIKVSKSLLKKCQQAIQKNGQCDMTERIAELDRVGDEVVRVSPLVDDFILSLYPPIDTETVQENGKELFDLHSKILDLMRDSHLTTEDDEKWVTFLNAANAHNMGNVHSDTSSVT